MRVKRIKIHLLAVLMLICAKALATNASLLDSLDVLLKERGRFEQQRRESVAEARMNYENATEDADKYNALRGLYENYRSYKIDSALIVAKLRLETARRLNEPSKIASATLNVAEAYVKSGSFEHAIMMLDTLDRNSLADYHEKYLNSIYRNAYGLAAEMAVSGADRLEALEKSRILRREAIKAAAPDSRGRYTLEAERLRDAGLVTEAVDVMEKADRTFDFSEDAAMQYLMGEFYLSAGRHDKAVEHLARSAILDISNGTKEYKSLILLASILFEEGQIERSLVYMTDAFEDANYSKANLRTTEIMKTLPLIERAYREKEKETKEQNRRFLILTSFLSVMLLLFLIVAVQQYRKKRRMLEVIRYINRELAEKNDLLKQSDALKLQYINILMMAYAKHISRLRDFRKKIYRFIKTSQFEKALDEVKWDKVEAQDISAFYEMFDEAFLKMFPDFVDKINKITKEPVSLKTAGRFTPELRVLAMMRLGMFSTDEISAMFHYSAQTVYNLRTSIRAMLKVSWEEMEAYLKTI